MNPLFIAILAFFALLWIIAVVVFGVFFFRPWIRSVVSGAPIPLVSIVLMRLRGAPVKLLLDAYIQLRHRGSTVPLWQVEKQFLASRTRIRNAGDLVDLVEQNAAQA